MDLDYILEVASTLIRINTENPPGREVEAASYVAERLAELGIKSRVDRFEGDRGNVVGELGGGTPSILFNTHLDTVPVGDKGLWSVPPLGGEVRDGRLFGRGAVDAKGSLASLIGALKDLADEGWSLKGRLIVAAVADEEVGGKGIKRLLSQGVRADYAIVGEPTGLKVCIAHKGRLLASIVFRGRPSHASSPEKGRNAIYGAAEFISRMEVVRFRKRHRLLGSPSLTVTMIRGGVKDNVVPDVCEVLVDRRFIPGEDVKDSVEHLRKTAEKVARLRGLGYEVRVISVAPPSESASSSLLVKTALQAIYETAGKKSRPTGFKATCDMTYLRQAGIETIILGPGTLSRAHTVDEWVEVGELGQAAEIYYRILKAMLWDNRA